MLYRLFFGKRVCVDFRAADNGAARETARGLVREHVRLVDNAQNYDTKPKKMREVEGLFNA